jgi:GNAT superfamily N-acetyltransferase
MERVRVRRATKADLAAIHVWLKDEKARAVPGNFLCNWSIIEKAQKQGRLLVYIDPASSQPIAFQLGGLLNSGILAVREEHRGKGIGRQFVEYFVRAANRKREPVLRIQCSPSQSIPFWERMGFVPCVGETDDCYHRVLPKKLKIPKAAVPTKVVIRFFPQERNWAIGAIAPYETHEVAGYRSSNGVVYLTDRIVFADGAQANAREVVVEIEVDGRSIYCQKAKYDRAKAFGVKRGRNGYYIDEINVDCGVDPLE